MSEAVIAKNSLAIAISAVSTAQAVAPAGIAVCSLYAVIAAYQVPLAPAYHALAIVVALLALLLMSSPNAMAAQDPGGPFPVSIALLIRWLLLLGTLLALGYVTKLSADFPRRIVLTWAAVTPPLIIAATLALQHALQKLLRAPASARTAVVAGCTDASVALAIQLNKSTNSNLSVLGFFDDRDGERLQSKDRISLLGKLADLPQFIKSRDVEVVFVALPIRHLSRVMALIDALRDTTASIYYVPDINVFDLIQSTHASIGGIPVISMCETPLQGRRAVAKRLLDITLAAALLVTLTPIMLTVALLVRCTSPGPVLFKQRRYGLNGEQIMVRKFRTMTVIEDGPSIVQAAKADARLTSVGGSLRRYSLDELPQLFDVLQGTMSLVGPRPHAVAHNELYRKLIKGYMVRHKVLPGITGWAQINGLRGETKTVDEMETRVLYDLEYLRRWSIKLDLKILAKTALRMLNDAKAY
jgi:putative colanic acid biosynthesis UDP-glucose lipid carrier transferase